MRTLALASVLIACPVYGGSVQAQAQASSQAPILQSLTACFNDAIQRNVVGKEEESATFQCNGQVAKSFFELLGQLDVETKDVADKAGTERYRFFGQSGCYHRIISTDVSYILLLALFWTSNSRQDYANSCAESAHARRRQDLERGDRLAYAGGTNGTLNSRRICMIRPCSVRPISANSARCEISIITSATSSRCSPTRCRLATWTNFSDTASMIRPAARRPSRRR